MARPFVPARRLSSRPGADIAALAALVDGDPDDLLSVLSVLAVTDPLVRDASAAFAGLSPGARYRGPGAAAVMLPFLRPSTSRFSTGSFGVLYGAESAETAATEVSYHNAKRLSAARAPRGTNVLLALWEFSADAEFTDVRMHVASIYDPNDYGDAQRLGQILHAGGAAGVIYRSVRRVGGECLGVFVPSAVVAMAKIDDWRLVWDGTAISEVLRVA